MIFENSTSVVAFRFAGGLQGTCITFTTLVAAMAKATVPRWLEALELVEMMLEGQMEVDVVAWSLWWKFWFIKGLWKPIVFP